MIKEAFVVARIARRLVHYLRQVLRTGEEPKKKSFLSSVSGSSSLDQVLCVFILALYLTLFPPQTNLLSPPSLSCSSLFMNKT